MDAENFYSYDLADERAYSNAKGSGSDEGSGETGAVGSVERGSVVGQ